MEALADGVGMSTTPIGTPGYVAGTQAMQLTLRTYLLAVALFRNDAARVLIHVGVATPQEIDVFHRVCVDSRLVGAALTLTDDGWGVARAMSPH